MPDPTHIAVSLSPEDREEIVQGVVSLLADQLATAQTGEGWLAPQAAADYLDISKQRLHDLKYAGKIKPDGSDGRTPLYLRETLDRYAREAK